jgi:hypothetical protein
VNTTITTEPINRSYLSDRLNWPSPDGRPQPSRPATEDDIRLVQEAGEQLDFDNPEVLKRLPIGRSDPAEAISRLLASKRLNFNGGRVYDLIRGRVAAATAAGERIRVVMPAFCKINNTAKLIWSLRPTAAEEASLRHLVHVSRALRRWYPPGVQFVLLTDASLYAPYLRNVAPTVSSYNQALHEMRDRVTADGEVELIEYDRLLASVAKDFEAAYADAMRRIDIGDPSFYLQLDRAPMFESVRNNLSTRGLGMTYQDLFDCFGPTRNRTNRFYGLLDAQAEESLRWKLATRAACRAVEPQVFAAAFGPNYVRSTIHVSRGESPALGLRIYPDYKRASDVLPYHGVPLFYREGAKVKMLIAPETRFFGDSQLVRVTHHGNETYLYREETM